MYRHKRKKHTEGFTLIEIIVSLGLFSVVMTISVGALFMIINANREAKAIKLVVNNINIAMEAMTRDLRVGSEYCDYELVGNVPNNSSCDSTNGTDIIYFTNDDNEQGSSYRLIDNSIQRRVGSSGSYLQLTGDDVVVEDLNFYIQGTEPGNPVQPYIIISARGTIQVGSQDEDFHLQSTISQRKLAP